MLDAANKMFTETRGASVVHDGDGRFGDGSSSIPPRERRHDRRLKGTAAQSQAVKACRNPLMSWPPSEAAAIYRLDCQASV